MKRRFNWSLPLGFLLLLAGVLTFPFFAQFVFTRSFAWVNLLIITAGVLALLLGSRRAFREPQLFRGKILGSILTALGVLLLGFFVVGIFYFGRVPHAQAAQKSGDKAPELTVQDEQRQSHHSPVAACVRPDARQRRVTHFLSRPLVTLLQLRVAEFSAKLA